MSLNKPLNDSFIDIDVLAQVDREKREVLSPSNYCKAVWELNNQRVVDGRPALDWIVMRNRLAHLEARNRREITMLLNQLARRIGFRLAPGFRAEGGSFFVASIGACDTPGGSD